MNLPDPQDDWQPVLDTVFNLIRDRFYKQAKEEHKGPHKNTMEYVTACFKDSIQILQSNMFKDDQTPG